MGKYDPAPTVASGLLRLARAKSGLTQSDLAKSARVSQQTVSAYETGRMEPTLPSLMRLLTAAGFELRMRLEPLDDHDSSLEAYVKQLPPELQSQLDQHQRERVENARLDRIRGH